MVSAVIFTSLLALGLGSSTTESTAHNTAEDSEVRACAYRCDPDDSFLDNGICVSGTDGECPSPDSSYVQDNVCWGLPFQPSPGDIELHDDVPFETQDACNAYITSWMSSSSLNGNYSAAGSDKTSYPDRGQMWETTMGVIKECASVAECLGLVKGMNGKEVQDCLNKCAFEYTEKQMEKWFCNYATATLTGGLATFFCNNVFGFIMQPINKFLNKFIEQPVIDAVTKIEDAVKSIGSKIAHFFHFGRSIVIV